MKILPPKRIFTRLMISYLLVTLAVLSVIAIIFINLMQKYFFSVEGFQLESQGEKAASLLERPLLEKDLASISRLADTIAFSYDIHFWVIDSRGSVLAIAGGDPEELGLQVEITEISHVLAGNFINKQITGPDYNSLIHMTPVYEKAADAHFDVGTSGGEERGPVIGALAICRPLGPVTMTITSLKRLVFYAAGGATVLALFLGYTLSRKMAQPLEDMSLVALAVSRGDYQKRISYSSDDELGQLANTLNFAIEQVGATIEQQHRLVKLQQEFISDISHEFRAPLTSLQGFLELMRDGKSTPEESKYYLDIMYKDTVFLGRLVQDLLDLTKLESQGITLERRRCNPETILRHSLKHLYHTAALKDI
ncbi:MAG: HAMP domain-containing sensor histidine kinase, partial [Dethiobacteria bacterium]